MKNLQKLLNRIGDRALKTEQNQLFRYYLSFNGAVLFIKHRPRLVIFDHQKVSIRTVYRLPWSHLKYTQADMHICGATMCSLKNGKPSLKKNFPSRWKAPSIVVKQADTKEREGKSHSLVPYFVIKIFHLEIIRVPFKTEWPEWFIQKQKRFLHSLDPWGGSGRKLRKDVFFSHNRSMIIRP